MKIGSLFTGCMGLDMAVEQVTGAETVWVSDIDKGACKILAHRTDAPNHGDITAIDWTQVEPVDILTGGFPCQDVSQSGRGAGLKHGTRSGLWSHMAEAIDQLQPSLVVAENVRGLLNAQSPSDVEPCPWCVGDGPTFDLRALGTVLADLADLRYDTQWCGLRAADVGSCHGRFRIFLIAYPADSRPRWELAPELGPVIPNGTPLLPTPIAAEGTKPSQAMGVARRAATGQVALTNVIVTLLGLDEKENLLPTPVSRDYRDSSGFVPRPESRRLPHTIKGEPFGDYSPAVERWAKVLGRPTPPPTEIRSVGRERLSPAFVEWMMGLPEGWVTDVPGLSWAEQLKALGNGVVPQQAVAALHHLLGDL